MRSLDAYKVPPANPHTVAAYALCAQSGLTGPNALAYETLVPPSEGADPGRTLRSDPDPNKPGSVLAVNRVRSSTFTDPATVGYDSLAIVGGGKEAEVHLSANESGARRGLALEFYDLYWTCTPNCTDKCAGPDGCGGTCPTVSCTNGMSCNASNQCSCPSGTISCNGACVAESACCPANQVWCDCVSACTTVVGCRFSCQ